MARPLHDELWSTLSLARTMHMSLDAAKISTTVSTASLKLILETFIGIADRNTKGADVFSKHVDSRIESVGKAQAEQHGAFADEQKYVANKIAAETEQA